MASIEEIRKIYDQFDQDKNGVLTIDEAEVAYKALGANAKAINFEEHFKKLQKPDLTINFEDFKTFAKISG